MEETMSKKDAWLLMKLLSAVMDIALAIAYFVLALIVLGFLILIW